MIHCNEGLSRSPSLALLYLASSNEAIDCQSYTSARQEFSEDYYPQYSPGGGIRTFLQQNWVELIDKLKT